MSCVIKWCKNRSDRRKKHPGITFHRFSKENEVWRNDWIQIIRNCNAEKEWIPNKYSVICSIHFEAKDLYTTKGGLRRVVTFAVPQKSATITVSALEPMVLQQEYQPNEPNISNASQERASMTVPKLEPIVLQQEVQPDETNIYNASQESTSMTAPALAPIVLQQEDQPDEPNISNASQESASLTVPELEPMVLQQEEQPDEPNISNASQERIGAAEEQVLSILYTPRKRRLKQSIIEKQAIIKKQKREIKTLKQKTKRLHERNKSLKNILKSLKKKWKMHCADVY